MPVNQTIFETDRRCPFCGNNRKIEEIVILEYFENIIKADNGNSSNPIKITVNITGDYEKEVERRTSIDLVSPLVVKSEPTPEGNLDLIPGTSVLQKTFPAQANTENLPISRAIRQGKSAHKERIETLTAEVQIHQQKLYDITSVCGQLTETLVDRQEENISLHNKIKGY